MLRVFGWAERFELLDCIGSGAMGQVWRAKERDSEKIVALKMLDPARVGDEQTLARLDIEAATLMKLREAGAHENIVPILDFKLTESHACLVMEFIPGLNLKKWCEAHRLGLRERVRLVAKVARASGWFHGQGIVHRDLKPANILVNAVTHQPVIVDFSIAKLDDSLPLTLTNEALGTAPYMAPEQIDPRRGGITPATDVYALGATLYELLTQVHPHPGDLTQVVRRHAEEVRPAPLSALNPEVPRDVDCICLKTLSYRPADRYADGGALAEDLERFLAGQPVQARAISRLTHLARQARRKPALTAALAACVALGVFALWNVQRRAAQRERFGLESKLISAMQQEVWSKDSLSSAEATIASLARLDTALATSLRQRLQQDVAHDIETRLQQSHLQAVDFTWLRSTTAWLAPILPEQAAHLQSLITDRAGRWQTQAVLRPPFADLGGLFPRSNVHVVDGLLQPLHDLPAATPPPIVITDAVSLAMEVDAEFVADGSTFHHLAFSFLHANAEIVICLYKTKHTPGTIRNKVRPGTLEPESYILYSALNGDFLQGVHITDARLLDQPFRLSLRVERERADATLNHQWHLRLDSPFALGSLQPRNQCRISWPADIGLRELTLSTRRSDSTSPLEQADLLAAQGQWAAARRLYENLRGDPRFGAEASYKAALCLLREGDAGAAAPHWERVMQGMPSVWRDRSLIQLWGYSHLRSDLAAASRYAALLPAQLPSDALRHLDPLIQKQLSDKLVKLGMGLVQPRLEPALIQQSDQLCRLLQTPPLAQANRLGMAYHFARLDQEARSLFRIGLEDPAACTQIKDGLTAAANCLDQWCRLIPSEKEPLLAERLEGWKHAMKGEVTIQALWHMEQARRAARAKNLRAAITSIRQAREVTPERLDNRLHTSLWLLEGMLYRMQGAEDRAQSAWRKARQIAATVTQRHPLHLFDSALLHSLTQAWDLRTSSDVLTTLVGRHLQEAAQMNAHTAFNQTFLADPAWLTTFNAVLQDEAGREFAEDYVLCRQPPRELVLRFYRLLFEHYFLTTAFAQATQAECDRVRPIVDQLVTEMAMNPRGEIADLYAYLRAWNDRAVAPTLFHRDYPYSPELIENMKWLLSMRQRQWILKAGK